ncbi:MAG: flagellar biosynthesis protein FliQ [Treponema sp.]|nr:flagellar biosynthesis protein FliQ [Spirochaetia bacterium]MDD7013947.1 flagellar biosynthesis protein FliQ [Spirochaetales bacterium]MDY4903165.1 flagellar biosynthesis protein FliQ [Treponema sp.]
MTLGEITNIMQQGIIQVLKLTAPVLGFALIIGLIVAIFQTTTSIQEQTLTFLPKLLTILFVLLMLGGWMFSSMRQYVINVFNMISTI